MYWYLASRPPPSSSPGHFAEESKTLKDSGLSSKMTSSCKWTKWPKWPNLGPLLGTGKKLANS